MGHKPKCSLDMDIRVRVPGVCGSSSVFIQAVTYKSA